MKKIVLIVVMGLLLTELPIFPCSSFCLKDSNNIVFGYNFDWYSSQGFAVTNNRGIKKTAFMPFNCDLPINWISKYGSITFNVFGKEFPQTGMNEKGLTIALLWLDDTKYQEADKRASIFIIHWVQYQLDNSATIEDVIQSDKILRITDKIAVPIHFLVSDRTENTATFEFLDGRLVYHTNDELPVPLLCNDKYDKSVKSLIEFMDFGNRDSDLSLAKAMVTRKYDDDRFIIGTNAIKKFQQKNSDIVESAFDVLGAMKQPHTRWSIVFDIKNFLVYYKTDNNVEIKKINFNDFKYDCDSQSMMLDVNAGKADEKNKFEKFTIEKNKQYINYIAEKIVPKINELKDKFPMEFWNKLGDYPNQINCE